MKKCLYKLLCRKLNESPVLRHKSFRDFRLTLTTSFYKIDLLQKDFISMATHHETLKRRDNNRPTLRHPPLPPLSLHFFFSAFSDPNFPTPSPPLCPPHNSTRPPASSSLNPAHLFFSLSSDPTSPTCPYFILLFLLFILLTLLLILLPLRLYPLFTSSSLL